MENKNRQERLAEFIKTLDNMQNSTITRTINGDETLKSILEGYNKNESSQSFQETPEFIILPGEEILDAIKKLNEQREKTFYDGYMSQIFERFSRSDFSNMDITEKPKEQADETGPMFFHEMFHSVDFGDYTQSIRQEETFSDDEVKYAEQFKFFLEFLTINKEFGDSTLVRIKREGNVISYSRLNQGIALDRHEITMTKSDNLKELYETIKETFGSEFVFGSKHEMIEGWSLLPTIGGKLMLEISSDNLDDRNWISKEIHNRHSVIVDEPKKF